MPTPRPADVPASSLHALVSTSMLLFADCGESDILRIAAESVASIGGRRALGCYRVVDGEYLLTSRSRPAPSIGAAQLRAQNGEGRLRLPGRRWGRALPVRDRFQTVGAIVVGADHEPPQAETIWYTPRADTSNAVATTTIRPPRCTSIAAPCATGSGASATPPASTCAMSTPASICKPHARMAIPLPGRTAHLTGEAADRIANSDGVRVSGHAHHRCQRARSHTPHGRVRSPDQPLRRSGSRSPACSVRGSGCGMPSGSCIPRSAVSTA